ncbi:C-3 sterol dehydrogenase [Dacryopinax primogenitus]|uniref:C-3 sterol dehydrogenase n=1 Tax=Dacryopinax primogenitus (strain DJM 731) TaxID=1858805 RepID=M5FRX7_DACPD|nr:C-3 sterol dehydrogenase [Dacryopinax primogenitus]EJU00011.1 C-3 sterol dehydrogenase [Dacryopinax primogenitus]
MPESYLVIGGSGFLGSHIVNGLLNRGESSVAVFDIVQRVFDDRIVFFSGDICNEKQLVDAIQKCQASVIIHTASPAPEAPKEVHQRVNVEGTRTVIAAAVSCAVPKLVYTSSAGVVFNRNNIVDADERMPFPQSEESYNTTKQMAEDIVIAANGKDGLATCALRPAGIFGPRDRLMMPSAAQAVTRGQWTIQIGKNDNIFDWTYVDNVVLAHLLACDKLSLATPPLANDELGNALPQVTLTTGFRRIPTSAAKPIGPSPHPDKEELAAQEEFNDPSTQQVRPVLRTKFDALSPTALGIDYDEDKSPLKVAGNTFFITGGEPLYQWDFFRAIWTALGADIDMKKMWHIPRSLGQWLALGAESWGWITGKGTNFTPFRVHYLTAERWHNIEKARRVLGYEPIVGVEEGIKRTVAWWLADQAEKTSEK